MSCDPHHKKAKKLDFKGVKLSSLYDQLPLVSLDLFGKPAKAAKSFKAFIDSLPDLQGAKDLRIAARAIARAARAKRSIMLSMEGLPIELGLGPALVDLMEKGILTSISTNGSALVHDIEVALVGATSQELEGSIAEAKLKVTAETGHLINLAATNALSSGKGLGYEAGKLLKELSPPNAKISVLVSAYKNGLPFTVHLALGTDIFNIHPEADGAALGKASLDDFTAFCELVANLEEGVFINLGSTVVMPEVFLKALSLTCNLRISHKGLTTINMNFISQYIDQVNFIEQCSHNLGTKINLTGHLEIMFPLLMTLALDYLKSGD
ncbi:MAG: hypothetical protein LBE38_08310 [Deltaproteobacteria bacterium]|jgi:deoxyhypusine synthase|nr:hypothetical protein [Deltaproteobacteria bacterium]